MEVQLFPAVAFLYLGSAGGAWAAAAFMTGDPARVAAVWTRQGAGLLAAAFCQAVAAVANPFAAVHFAWQQFIARQAAGNVLQMTRDVAALLWVEGRKKKSPVSVRADGKQSRGEMQTVGYLVLPHAPPLGQVSAGRTLLLAVAVVKH